MVSRGAKVLLIGLLGMFCQGTQLPPPKPNDSADGVHVSPKVRLRDGRYLAYREKGVPKDQAKHIIIIVHGFGSSKDMNFLAPQELIDELGIYILQYDRAGYGESDPNPKRSLKSEALDIEELADQLQIGSKFYVIGVSMGLAGVAMIAPVINYQWPSFPESLIKKDYKRKLIKCAVLLAKYFPRLLLWWEKLREQVVFDTLRDDWLVAFGEWEFDPLKLSNPFPHNTSSAHIWQGYEDKVVPSQIQRFVTEKLPWIQYHEVPDGGHLIVHYSGVCEAILKALLLGEQNLLYRPRSGVSVS
ncbi:hypothetical protein LR48_Vigan08g138400 [Vigna angularis]|uniref:AB hydrolase-1 domain-containing protein n=1 Tax=Phaseolus angularis TaxID=3914 RepID=A0A0L9V6K9_PHAAN|nr:hypothetical protein LR48_Vigan08g138400 [Vigna angularis]